MAEEQKKIILSVEADTSDANKNLNDLKGKVNDLGNVSLDKPFKTFKAQIKEATIEATKMEVQFGKNSVQFTEAAKKVAALKDEFEEFNNSVNAFNPDNKLQALVSLGGAGISAIQGITGAMALLGVESEDTQKTIAKLQALMALSDALNSVDSIKNAYKDFGTVIQSTSAYKAADNALTSAATPLMKLFGLSVESSSGALKGFKIALASLGIGLIIAAIGVLVEHFDQIKEALGFSSQAQEEYNKTIEDYNKAAATATQKVSEVKTGFELARKGVISKKEALQKYNDTLGDTFGRTNDLTKAEKLLTEKADAYIKITGLKAQANALFALSAQKTSEALLASQQDQTGFLDKAKSYILEATGQSGAAVAVAISAQQKGVDDAVKKANESAKTLTDQAEQILQNAAELGKSSGIDSNVLDNKDTSAEDKKRADEAKARAEKAAELLKQERDKLKQYQTEIQQITDAANKVAGESVLNEREKELDGIDEHFRDENAALQKNYAEQLEILKSELKRKAISQADYNNQIAFIDQQNADAVVAIANEKGAKTLEVEKKYNKLIYDFIDSYQENSYQQSRKKLIDDFDEKIKLADDKQKVLLEKLKTEQVQKLDTSETLRKNTITTETTLVNVQTENTPSDEDTPETKVAKLQAIWDAEKEFKEAQFQEELAKLDSDEEAKANLRAKYNAEITQDEADHAKARTEIAEQEKKAKTEIVNQIGNVLNQAADLAGKSTVAGKALAVASTTISTYQSAMGAFKGMVTSIPGPVGIALGVAAAALATATGIANVKKILAVKVPAKGAGGTADTAPPPPPTINSTLLDPKSLEVKDVRVTNPQDQLVKAYISNRDLQENDDKKQFLKKLSSF